MTKVSAKQNKARAKQDERDVARIIGGKRHPADVGGLEDIAHAWLSVQVKGGLRVANDTIRDGLDAARAAAVSQKKLGAVVLVDRANGRVRRFIAFDLDEWAAWHGEGE